MRPRLTCLVAAGLAGVCFAAVPAELPAAEAAAPNLARLGEAKSWLPASQASPHAPLANANDGDPLTFWASTVPSTDPPKDLGIEWREPREVGSVRARFFSLGYVPAPDGWRVETLDGEEWRRLDARLENGECEWWTFRFPTVTTQAIRLVVTAYAAGRPSVCELEVYEGAPPAATLRRAALLDGAFWAFHYAHWAERFKTDADLAAEVAAAHRAGLDTLILYTGEGGEGSFGTVVPGTALPQMECWKGRDPLEAILSEADRLGMRVTLGDASPTGYLHAAVPAGDRGFRKRLDEYREQMLTRYSRHPSLVGYYINYECLPDGTGNNPAMPAARSEELALLVKRVCPRLRVIQPVGLYQWRDSRDAPWRFVTPKELRAFWRPFIQTAKHVDVFMVIDGVGTGLSPLNHTDLAQGCLRELCDEAGKEMWTDVECAEMGRRYLSYRIGRLLPSIEVAAKHAAHIVTFDFTNYMSPNNSREPARKLYEEYLAYRKALSATDR